VLDGKVCVVTGGANGMGRATAVEMARQGARGVVISDVKDDEGGDPVRLVEEAGGEAIYVRCNQRPDVKATVDATLAAKGTVVIDFVVEKEDTVFPMVPAGADLDKMIRRPKQDVMLESGSDKDWEMPPAPGRLAANSQAKKTVNAPKTAKKPVAAAPSRGVKTAKSNRR